MDFASQIQQMQQQLLRLENLWQFAGFTPNESQRDAILHTDGPLYLTAGPGSGKTRVLLWRTVNLIVFHGVSPEEIFLSTFTEKAAFQLKEGLRTLLGLVTNINGKPYDLSRMYVGTVHSLCQNILSDRRRFSVDRERVRPPRLLDELGQYFHLYKNRNWQELAIAVGLGEEALNSQVNRIFGRDSLSKHNAVTNCISFFNRLSEECIDAETELAAIAAGQYDEYLYARDADPEHLALLIRLYAAYRNSLVNPSGFDSTDFSLVQQEAYNVLAQTNNAGNVFRYVIVDEYQDTNTIQERIFFKLSEGHGNICVVGDDDQALYRFRGATVENFVQFPGRSQKYLNRVPRRIALSTNYRSRENIVGFYNDFMGRCDWRVGGSDQLYRVDKTIVAHREDDHVSVVATEAGHPDNVSNEIAQLVRRLLDEGKVSDPNQIAFLFPSVRYRGNMTKPVERMKQALEDIGLQVYAPRAGRFLDVDEAYDVFGIFTQVFGTPRIGEVHGHDFNNYVDWLRAAETQGRELLRADPVLKRYVEDRQAELQRVSNDWRALNAVVTRNGWDLRADYSLDRMKRALYTAQGLSDEAKRTIGSAYLDRIVRKRIEENNPLSLQYVMKRAASIDWNVLDLFYRICGFDHFRRMFDLAEQGNDEGPVSNLGLITQYLSRFMDEYVPLITADFLVDDLFQRVFFFSYLFALYRLGESEHEDADDPFPKGRIPFLTVHQSKGLEFPVVVMMSPRKDNRGPSRVEEMVYPMLDREGGEPLDRMAEFDIMRMFYVALSRAKNLLVLGHLRSRGNWISEPFKTMLDGNFPRIRDLDLDTIPPARIESTDLPQTYSFTSDFLMYRKCPRQYMIFRKYGFVPSRSQTMFFGSLVHRTLEDLHHELIRRREQNLD